MTKPDYYKKWYFNIYIITLAAITVTLILVGFFEMTILLLVILTIVVISVINRCKKYNQRMIALLISQRAEQRDDLESIKKANIKLHLALLSNYIDDYEYFEETVYRKFWPSRIPEGLYDIYELAVYWNDDDILRCARNDSEVLYAKKVKEDANLFIAQLKKNRDDDWQEKIEWAKSTGKSISEVLREERQIEEEMNERIRKRDKEWREEDMKRHENNANLIFTGLTNRCPYCLKKISTFARKCPHCTADLRT